MVGLTRRLLRAIAYTVVFFAVTSTLLLVANKNEYININSYIPYDVTPTFFQPPAGAYVVDIRISKCFKMNSNNVNCGVPDKKEGLYGDLGELGGWVKVDKDLSLGSSLLNKYYLSYKIIKDEAFKNSKAIKLPDDKVITDIAIYHESEPKIKGNKNKIPIKILHEFRNNDIFDDEDHELYLSFGIKGELYSENSEDIKASKGNQAMQDKIDEEDAKKAAAEAEEQEKNNELGEEDPEPEAPKQEEVKEKEGGKKQSDKAKENGEPTQEKDTGKQSKQKDNEKESEDNKESEEAKESEDTKDSNDVAGAQDTKKSKDTDDSTPKLSKRIVETSVDSLKIHFQIPTQEELDESHWHRIDHDIWVKYESYTTKKGLTAIDVLFGEDSVEPRPNWNFVLDGPVKFVTASKGREPYLSFRRGPKVDYRKNYSPKLKVNKDGKLKILQVADLHFSTGFGKCRDPTPKETAKGCLADPRTLDFLEQVLDYEKPDLVVLTGDQIFGDEAPDSETALFKAVHPFIQRKIPFAATLGNHDDEGSLSRNEMMALLSNLPYSLAAAGPQEIDGVGNYIVNIQDHSTKNSAILLYFLDSHKYSQNPKVNPGYDWIKESQLSFVEREYASFQKSIEAFSQNHLSMAFFHIPLPEYRQLNQPFIGDQKEGVTAPRYNTGARRTFADVGVKAISVGHDHCNDYCLEDSLDINDPDANKMWLCYGGGAGEGGYGGYGGFIRRVRAFELDVSKGEIRTWKRIESNPESKVHEQIIVSDSQVVNFR